MDNTLKFGLSDSLINAVREVVEGKVCPTCGKSPCQCDGDVKKVEEALKGGQKKLDKNHNGKLDKQDFKMMHKEEVEELDELSRKTLNSYAYKADKQLTTVNANGPSHKAGIPGHYRGNNKDLGKDPADKMRARKAGIKMAVNKLNKEEVEDIDEGNPANKEKKNAAATAVGAKNRDDQHLGSRGMRTDVADKIRGRQIQKEDIEQLDELSPKTLYSYGSKAHNQVIKTGMGLTKRQGGLRTKGVSLEDGKRKMANRKAGVELAHKKAQAKTNEEVQFSEAELAHIEKIVKGL